MSVTKQLSPSEMHGYFDRFTKRFLNHESTDVADVRVIGMDLGDQVEAEGSHLKGITYDPHTQAVEIALESGDVRAVHPKAVWAIEEEDGFIRAVEIVRDDDTRDIVRVTRHGVRRAD